MSAELFNIFSFKCFDNLYLDRYELFSIFRQQGGREPLLIIENKKLHLAKLMELHIFTKLVYQIRFLYFKNTICSASTGVYKDTADVN